MLPIFATPVLEDDGVHLTAYSGLEFMLHMFDSSKSVIESASLSPEATSSLQVESTRVIEDRLMAVEQDHKRLNQAMEKKMAVDAE